MQELGDQELHALYKPIISDICQPDLSPTYGTMEGLGFKVQALHIYIYMCSLVNNNNTCENIVLLLGVFDCAKGK